jgi:hypothetical protein
MWDEGMHLVKILGTDADDRGMMTVRKIGLDRMQLQEERAELLRALQIQTQTMIYAQMQNNAPLIAKCAEFIAYETARERPFAGFRRFYFRQMGLAAYISTD